MRLWSASTLAVIAVLVLPASLSADQNILKNGSMESGEGAGAIDPHVAAEWTEFGENVERSDTVNLVPPGEGHALKAFGDPGGTNVGAYQIVQGINSGNSILATVQLHTPGDDKLGGTGQAGLVIEFLDFFGKPTGPIQSIYVLNSSSPADTWIEASLGPLTAPASTTQVRVACRLQWTAGNISGAAYWDDAQLTIDGGENKVVNGDFETAGAGQGQSPVGIDDWMGFEDQEKSQDVAKDGTSSLKLGTTKPYSGLWQNMRVLNAGDHIFLIAYIWNPSSDPLTGTSLAGIKLEFDPNVSVPPPQENLPFDETTNPDQWIPVSLNTTVPDEVTIARVVVIFAGDTQTTGAVYFDSASAERGGQPGVNQLSNFSFEAGPGGPNGIDLWTEFGSGGAQTQKDCYSVPAHDGYCTARAAGTNFTGIWQEISVTPGESLSISAYIRTPSGSEQLTGSGHAGVKVEWAVGGVPDDIDIGGPPNTINASAPTDTWIPVTIDYTMPAGSSALARFTNIIAKGNALSGTVYFDSCEAVLLNQFDGSDVDGDDDEDLLDFAMFQRVFTGPGPVELPWPGLVFDSDQDSDVDMSDFDFFAVRMTGPQ
jgi:hypothetical protein